MTQVFPNFAAQPPPISDLQQFYRDAKKVDLRKGREMVISVKTLY